MVAEGVGSVVKKLGGEGAVTDARAVALEDADDTLDVGGADADADGGAAAGAAGDAGGDIRVGTMVQVEEGALSAFEEEAYSPPRWACRTISWTSPI